MARSAAQAVPATASAGGAGGSLTSLAAQVAERKRALAREVEAQERAEEHARSHGHSRAQAQAQVQARPNRAARPEGEMPASRPGQRPGQSKRAATQSRPAAQPRIVARPAPAAEEAVTIEPRRAVGAAVPAADPGAGAGAGALRDLSAKLDTIKTDLMGVKRTLSRRDADGEAQKHAESHAREHAETRAEIERIASGIEALQAAPRFDAAGFDKLQDELAELRQSMRSDIGQTVRNEVAPVVEGAIEGALAGKLGGRDAQMGEAVEQLSRGLDAIGRATAEASTMSAREVMPKVEALAGQFAELREQVQDLPNTLTINRLEGKLREIAEAVEKVESHDAAPSHFELEGFAQIESRLDEITRALVAVGMGQEARAFDPSAIDLSGLERLEGRMADLMGQIDQIGAAQEAAAQAAAQAAAAQAAAAEAAEIEQVSQQLSALSERLVEIERYAETSHRAAEQALDHAPNFSALETQLSALVKRLDDQAEADMSAHQLAALEGQLVQLAQAMDGMGRAQQAMQENVRDAVHREAPSIDFSPLEARLAEIEDRIDSGFIESMGGTKAVDFSPLEHRLAGMEDRIRSGLGEGASPVDFAPLESRLAGIEDRIDQGLAPSGPVDGQAQRQIALQAAQAAAAQVAEVMGGGADAEMLAELSRDMHAVQEALVRGDDRNAETFEAVRRTLDAVGDRLATIEHGLNTSTKRLSTIEHGLNAGTGRVEAALASLSAAPAPVTPPAMTPAMPLAAQLVTPTLDPAPHFAETVPGMAPAASGMAPAADAPIEPNAAGAPDIDDIVRRATERLNSSTAVEDPQPFAQAGDGFADGYGEPRLTEADAPTDVVAAARRAVQATRAELDAVAGETGAGINLSDRAGGLTDLLRKPLIALSAAVALAAVAFGGWYVTRGEAPAAPRISEAAPAAAPAAMDVARVDTDAPTVREVAPVPQRAEVVPSSPVAPVAPGAPGVDAPALDNPVAARAPSSDLDAAPGVDEAFDPAGLPDAASAELSDEMDARFAPPSPVKTSVQRAIPDRAELPAPAVEAPVASLAPEAASPEAASPEPARAAPAGAAPAGAAPRAVARDIPAGIAQPALREAAKSGDRLALHEIGTRFSDGRGVGKDLEKAAAWFGLSAERGFAPAEYALGSLHEKGMGVTRDIPRAVELYKSAAAKGNARAMHNLAVIQAMGAAGQADMPSATRWFHEAASLGVKDSQFNLGILYGQGMGVPQNLAESYKWFAIAAGSGDSDAGAKRDEVAAVMDAETLKRAKTLVAEWEAAKPTASANSVAVPTAWGAPRPQVAAAAAAPQKPKPAAIPAATVKRAQGLLNRIGYEIGRPDGKIGPRTRAALAAFQRTWSLPATGKLDKATLNALEDANT